MSFGYEFPSLIAGLQIFSLIQLVASEVLEQDSETFLGGEQGAVLGGQWRGPGGGRKALCNPPAHPPLRISSFWLIPFIGNG